MACIVRFVYVLCVVTHGMYVCASGIQKTKNLPTECDIFLVLLRSVIKYFFKKTKNILMRVMDEELTLQ